MECYYSDAKASCEAADAAVRAYSTAKEFTGRIPNQTGQSPAACRQRYPRVLPLQSQTRSAATTWMLLLIGMLIVASLPQMVEAAVGSHTVGLVRGRYALFGEFGYDVGGTLNFEAKVLNGEPSAMEQVRLMMCTAEQYYNIKSEEMTQQCDGGSIPCELAGPLGQGNNSIAMPYTVKRRNYYYLFLVGCSKDTVKFQFTYTLLNPGGSHLSYGDQPLPGVLQVLALVWSGLLVVYWLLWIRYPRTPVHSLLLVVVTFKSGVCVASYFWIRSCTTGHCTAWLQYIGLFCFAVSETAFFCALLLVAKGWRITRYRLPATEGRTISVALLLLLITLVFFSFYDHNGYYLLSLMIMYFFMLPKIMTSVGRNIRVLDAQILVVSRAHLQVESNSLWDKLNMFKHLRSVVVVYLGAILLANSLRIVLPWTLAWLKNHVLFEVLSLAMVVAILWLLLPSRRGLFSSTLWADSSLAGGGGANDDAHAYDDDYLWDGELPMLALPLAEDLDPRDLAVVVYPNPRATAVNTGTTSAGSNVDASSFGAGGAAVGGRGWSAATSPLVLAVMEHGSPAGNKRNA